MRWLRSFTFIVLNSALALGARAEGLVECYGHNGLAYQNNTRCPGSNACCGPSATCMPNRLCHYPKDGAGILVRGPCAVNPYDFDTCAQICVYGEFARSWEDTFYSGQGDIVS